MKHNRIVIALAVALVGTIAVTGCKKKEEPVAAAPVPVETAPAPVEPAPAPAPATSYAVAAGTAADPIVVTISTDASVPVEAALAAKLTYQDGQTAGEENTTIKAEDAGTTKITFKKASPWPTGKYKVDVTLNGTAVGMTQEVEIK